MSLNAVQTGRHSMQRKLETSAYVQRLAAENKLLLTTPPKSSSLAHDDNHDQDQVQRLLLQGEQEQEQEVQVQGKREQQSFVDPFSPFGLPSPSLSHAGDSFAMAPAMTPNSYILQFDNVVDTTSNAINGARGGGDVDHHDVNDDDDDEDEEVTVDDDSYLDPASLATTPSPLSPGSCSIASSVKRLASQVNQVDQGPSAKRSKILGLPSSPQSQQQQQQQYDLVPFVAGNKNNNSKLSASFPSTKPNMLWPSIKKGNSLLKPFQDVDDNCSNNNNGDKDADKEYDAKATLLINEAFADRFKSKLTANGQDESFHNNSSDNLFNRFQQSPFQIPGSTTTAMAPLPPSSSFSSSFSSSPSNMAYLQLRQRTDAAGVSLPPGISAVCSNLETITPRFIHLSDFPLSAFTMASGAPSTHSLARSLLQSCSSYLTMIDNIPRLRLSYQMDELSAWTQVMHGLFDKMVNAISSFVRTLPGFRELCPADRVLLFTRAYYPILVTQLSLTYDMDSGTCNFFQVADDTTRQILKMLLCGCGEMFEKQLNEAGFTLASWKPNSMEVALLCGLLFFDPNVAELEEPEKVRRIMNAYHLVDETFNSHRQSPDGQHSVRFTSLLPYFKPMYQLLAMLMRSMEERNPDFLYVHPLWYEMASYLMMKLSTCSDLLDPIQHPLQVNEISEFDNEPLIAN